jgi:hypothetical protein
MKNVIMRGALSLARFRSVKSYPPFAEPKAGDPML